MSKDSSKYISSKTAGNYTLLSAGEEYAQQILSEIANTSFTVSPSKGGRKPGKKSAPISSTNDTSSKSNSPSNRNPSPLEMCNRLLAENFFDAKKILNDILLHCEQKKAIKYTSQSMHNGLTRLVKNQILEREKNSDGQYEYWKK